jgi:F0F1-type ATP synthase delta subunit
VNDLAAKGALRKGQKVAWNVRVDPAILGGVVYNMGDTLVDASVKSLQDEFYASLSAAGIARVE